MSAAPEGRYDLLTLGETLLRLSPPGSQRFDQTRLFEIAVGGSELNVGCLLARLGRRVAWVSRLPEGPLGRIVDGEARRHGVDTAWVRWIPNARLGLVFYEPGPAPRTSRIIYDRKHSAASELGFEDAPWETLVQASAWLHLSDITPALGPALPRPDAAHRGPRRIRRQAGLLRLQLSRNPDQPDRSPRRVRSGGTGPLFSVLAERDAQQVLGFAEAGTPLAEAIARRYRLKCVALTRPPGAEPGSMLLAADVLHDAPRYDVTKLSTGSAPAIYSPPG